MKNTYINPNVTHQHDQPPQICPLGSDGAKLRVDLPTEVMTERDKFNEISEWLKRKQWVAARRNFVKRGG